MRNIRVLHYRTVLGQVLSSSLLGPVKHHLFEIDTLSRVLSLKVFPLDVIHFGFLTILHALDFVDLDWNTFLDKSRRRGGRVGLAFLNSDFQFLENVEHLC